MKNSIARLVFSSEKDSCLQRSNNSFSVQVATENFGLSRNTLSKYIINGIIAPIPTAFTTLISVGMLNIAIAIRKVRVDIQIHFFVLSKCFIRGTTNLVEKYPQIMNIVSISFPNNKPSEKTDRNNTEYPPISLK